jgi:hypothetical protein
MKKFSVSEANDFKTCPRYYYHKHVQGWELLHKPSWLAKGTAYDKLLENWDVVGFEAALKTIPELFPNPYEAVDAEYILTIYNEKFKDQPLRPVTFDNRQGNQLGFGLDFHGNENTGPVEFRATGYLDKLAEDEGDLIVVERKTTSEAIEPNSAFWAKWTMDPQVRSYVWYLRQMGVQNAGWVVVEAIRKLSTVVNAKAYNKTVPIEEYRAQVMSHVEKKTLVARHRFFVSEDMTQEWIVNTAGVYHNIADLKFNQGIVEGRGLDGQYAWYQNEKGCQNYGGCQFLSVCEGKCTVEGSGLFVKSEKWLKQQKEGT